MKTRIGGVLVPLKRERSLSKRINKDKKTR